MTCVLPIPSAEKVRIRPIHVLTITPFYPAQPGDGRGGFVAEPLAATAECGVRNTVIAVRPFYRATWDARDSGGTYWKTFPSIPGNIGLPFSGYFLYSRIAAAVRVLHRQQAIDIIHAHAALPCGVAAARISHELGLPFVVTVHGRDAFSTNQVKGTLGRWCERLSREVYESAAQVLCVSQKVREAVLESAPRARTTVVYNGVDTELFAASGGVEGQEPIVLCVGNLIPCKGQDLLIRAIAAISERGQKVQLEIIGEGCDRRRLESFARDLNVRCKVQFLGRQPRAQVAAAMRRCTVFALPSHYEGLGCVYLEAMASGKPVIGCRGQGIDEVIRHRSNGCLIEPNDLPGLVHELHALLVDRKLAAKIGSAARETIIERFSISQQANQLVSVYEECMQ